MSSPEQPTFSHSGQRYLLGYTSVEYGIWDRQAPGGPVQRFPKSDQGWADAWGAYQSMEASPAAPAPAQAESVPARVETAPASAATPPPVSATPASAPTAQLPAAAPGPGFQITGALVGAVLRITAWVLLVVLPVAGIGFLILSGGPFGFKMFGVALIALGPAFWGICTVLAKAAQD